MAITVDATKEKHQRRRKHETESQPTRNREKKKTLEDARDDTRTVWARWMAPTSSMVVGARRYQRLSRGVDAVFCEKKSEKP
jgi:hypothetical protein